MDGQIGRQMDILLRPTTCSAAANLGLISHFRTNFNQFSAQNQTTQLASPLSLDRVRAPGKQFQAKDFISISFPNPISVLEIEFGVAEAGSNVNDHPSLAFLSRSLVLRESANSIPPKNIIMAISFINCSLLARLPVVLHLQWKFMGHSIQTRPAIGQAAEIAAS